MIARGEVALDNGDFDDIMIRITGDFTVGDLQFLNEMLRDQLAGDHADNAPPPSLGRDPHVYVFPVDVHGGPQNRRFERPFPGFDLAVLGHEPARSENHLRMDVLQIGEHDQIGALAWRNRSSIEQAEIVSRVECGHRNCNVGRNPL